MDNQRFTEKKLSVAYSLCVIFGITTAISVGVPYGHWKETLDYCGNLPQRQNCSCILYGVNTLTYFHGGSNHICNWITFGPLVYVLILLLFACFHGFRVLFGATNTQRTITTKNAAGELVTLRTVETDNTSPLPTGFWITKSVITVFLAVYALAHFSVFLNGYYQTCNEYRKTVEKLVGIRGTAALVFNNRLGCNAIFDFMDYIQPDTPVAQRYGTINTAASLIIGLITSFFSFVLLSFASIWNINQGRG